MNRFVSLLFLGVFGVGVVPGQEKKIPTLDAAKLIGRWDILIADNAKVDDVQMEMEFTKENRAIVAINIKGNINKINGSYKIDGEHVTITMPIAGGKEQTDTYIVTKLTDSDCEMQNKDKKTTVYKKKK